MDTLRLMTILLVVAASSTSLETKNSDEKYEEIISLLKNYIGTEDDPSTNTNRENEMKNEIQDLNNRQDDIDSVGRFAFPWMFINSVSNAKPSQQCGNPSVRPNTNRGNKIVNGDEAVPHSWPWQISLREGVGRKKEHICGGTIISPNVVLSAAHCLFDGNHPNLRKDSYRIVAGDHDQTTTSDGPTQVVSVSAITYHPKYDPTSTSSAYDIALFTLATSLKYDQTVMPACLPVNDPSPDALCFATGWGDTKGTGNERILNQVRLPIISLAQCRQRDYYGNQITDTMICAGYAAGIKDACQGDSGGPFVCKNNANGRWYVQGITSWGADCAQPKKPGVYTRVNKYLDWIKANSGVVP